MLRYIICFSAVTLLSCSNKKSTDPDEKETGSKDSTGQKDSENDTSSQDSTHSDGSTDNQESDDHSSETSATDGQELLYEFPELDGSGGQLYNLDVDDEFIYFTKINTLYRTIKTGADELVAMGRRPTGATYQTMAFSGDNAFWLVGDSVARWNRSAGDLIELSFEGSEIEAFLIAADSEKIYLSEVGFNRIVTMTHNGENLQETETYKWTGDSCGTTILLLNEQHVYAGCGGCGPNVGKVVRWPKQGGELEEIVSLPELEIFSPTLGPQVTGMAIVEGNLFMVSNYQVNAKMQYFSVCSLDDLLYTRISELTDTLNTKRLHFDQKTNALFFLTQGDTNVSGIYKYSIQDGTFQRFVTEGARPPMAADEDYLYWHSDYQIFRMKKQ